MKPDDRGIGLVEVMIGALVGAVMLTLVATVLVTTLRSTASTQDRDLATGRAQAISTSLSTSLRTADAVRLDPSDAGILRARIPLDAGSWECRAWAVTDLTTGIGADAPTTADGHAELRVRTYPPLAADGDTPAPDTTWGALADRVEPADGAALFEIDRDPETARAVRVDWHLVVTAADQQTLSDGEGAEVSGAAAPRGYGASEGTPSCWH